MTDSQNSENTEPRDTEELRTDIAQTRAEMEQTIDEIEERVAPRRVLQRSKDQAQQRLDDLPVGAIAGAGGGVLALSTVAGLVRRQRAQARVRAQVQQQREQAAGGAAGLGAVVVLLSLVRLVRSRRRRRSQPTVRRAMTPNVVTVAPTDSLVAAADRMADLDVGSLPVCGPDGRLEGMLTDRDIVVKAIARGDDPRIVTTSQVATTDVVTIGADEPVTAALQTMSRHAVRRLPVVDEGTLVGVVTQGDLAVYVDDEQVGDLVEDVSAAPGDRR